MRTELFKKSIFSMPPYLSDLTEYDVEMITIRKNELKIGDALSPRSNQKLLGLDSRVAHAVANAKWRCKRRKKTLAHTFGASRSRLRLGMTLNGNDMEASRTKFVLEAKDCVKGMQDMEGKSVDIVVTSPPYNLGIKYRNYDDTQTREEYLKWSKEWARGVKRVLKDDGSFFLNLGASPSNPLIPFELMADLKKIFTLQNTFHWIKSISIETKEGEQISAGHFKPIHSKRYVNDCHEYVFHLTTNGNTPLDRLAVGVPYSDKSNIRRWSHTSGRDLRCRGNNWFIPYKTIVSRTKERPHPATFPTALAVNCIKIHGCNSKSVMLDPFLGIGHSALAAKECEIGKFFGFDIDTEYVEVARQALVRGTTSPTDDLRRNAGRKRKLSEETLL